MSDTHKFLYKATTNKHIDTTMEHTFNLPEGWRVLKPGEPVLEGDHLNCLACPTWGWQPSKIWALGGCAGDVTGATYIRRDVLPAKPPTVTITLCRQGASFTKRVTREEYLRLSAEQFDKRSAKGTGYVIVNEAFFNGATDAS